jgi:hypothetical protein
MTAPEWIAVPVGEVRLGERVRHRGAEFTLARIDEGFLGRDDMVCFIEDSSERWHAYPARLADAVEVLRNPEA